MHGLIFDLVAPLNNPGMKLTLLLIVIEISNKSEWYLSIAVHMANQYIHNCPYDFGIHNVQHDAPK